MARKNKKKKVNKWDGIDLTLKDAYATITIDDLQKELRENQSKLKEFQERRNYIQMDRDMIEKFFLNTRAKREEVERKIKNREAFA
jgi:uncharacterized protein (DUF3084 family)